MSYEQSHNYQPPTPECRIHEEECKDKSSCPADNNSSDGSPKQSDTLKGIGKVLCEICKRFVDPYNHLACYHAGCGQVFCSKWLQDHATKRKTCPSCWNSIDKNMLKPAKIYQKFYESTRKLYKRKDTNWPKFWKNKDEVVWEENSFVCPNHNRETDLYCTDCQMIVCTRCLANTGAHRGHDFHDFKTRFQKIKDRLGILLILIILLEN